MNIESIASRATVKMAARVSQLFAETTDSDSVSIHTLDLKCTNDVWRFQRLYHFPESEIPLANTRFRVAYFNVSGKSDYRATSALRAHIGRMRAHR